MDSLANAFIAGANDYITKPINRIELLARVRAALKLKAELERRRSASASCSNFLSSWGDRRATLWIDEATGLFVGEVAEAYLASTPTQRRREPLSVITLAVDRLEACRAADGDAAVNIILASVAAAIRGIATTMGVIAACYRNGVFVIVAPGYDGIAAGKLAEALRGAVARLAIASGELIAAAHVTASVAVNSGYVTQEAERIKLLTQAIGSIQNAAGRGGNEVIAMRA